MSGANGTEPPGAVGVSVPSSRVSVSDAPRAAYEMNVRSRPSTVIVVSLGPSQALSPHRTPLYPLQPPGFAIAYARFARVARAEFSK